MIVDQVTTSGPTDSHSQLRSLYTTLHDPLVSAMCKNCAAQRSRMWSDPSISQNYTALLMPGTTCPQASIAHPPNRCIYSAPPARGKKAAVRSGLVTPHQPLVKTARIRPSHTHIKSSSGPLPITYAHQVLSTGKTRASSAYAPARFQLYLPPLRYLPPSTNHLTS